MYIHTYIYYNIGGRASATNDNHIYIFISTSIMQPHAVMESPVRGSYGVPHLLPIPAICARLDVLCFHVLSCGPGEEPHLICSKMRKTCLMSLVLLHEPNSN